ncbi:MAG: hypothetical protein ACWGMZ_03740 [Thermoguttaceae bacterium]
MRANYRLGIQCFCQYRPLSVVVFLFLITGSAEAQFVPGPYYYQDAGVVGSIAASFDSAVQQRGYNQNRQLQATSSIARSLAWQNINRSMQNQAMSRPAAAPDTAQAARDWMNQYESSTSRYASRPMTLPQTTYTPVSSAESRPKAPPKEIMLWPTILKSSAFDDERASVEEPFRRSYADGKPLSVEDYQKIIETVNNMKATLKTMKPQLVELEYNAVEKYLDDLIADAENASRPERRLE